MIFENPKIRFEEWYNQPKELVNPDRLFDHKHVVTCNTYQIAIQMCLELLGTRIAPLPVILPITASPQTVTATLRSGAHPMLLDVDSKTLQMNPEHLDQILSSLEEGAIVILPNPGGMPIETALISTVDKHQVPWIADTRLLPDNSNRDKIGTFSIYDLTSLCTSGGLIVSKFPQQTKELRIIRSGILGHSATLSPAQAIQLKTRLSSLTEFTTTQHDIDARYRLELRQRSKDGIIVFEKSSNSPYFMIKVGDAKKVVAHLDSYNIEAVLGIYPLHFIDELRNRWQDVPEYPVAEELSKHLVCLPTHPGVVGHESFIISKLLEIV